MCDTKTAVDLAISGDAQTRRTVPDPAPGTLRVMDTDAGTDVGGYWILNGPGHRAAEAERMVVAIAEVELSAPGEFEHVIVDGGEDWVCDRCMGEVPLFQPDGIGGPDPTKLPPTGSLRPIPVVVERVLCPDCFRAVLPDIRVSRRWPGCGCAPCQDADSRT